MTVTAKEEYLCGADDNCQRENDDKTITIVSNIKNENCFNSLVRMM